MMKVRRRGSYTALFEEVPDAEYDFPIDFVI